MFHGLLQYIEPFLQTYGAVGVFLATFIEEMIAPFPTTLVVFTAGLLLTHGQHGSEVAITLIFKVILPAAAGMTLGSLFPYYVARIGERVAIDRFGRYLGVDWSMIEKVKAWSDKSKSDELLIFGVRAIPGLPSIAMSILAGLARIGVGEYMLYTFLGCIVRVSILSTAGWFGGRQYGFAVDLLDITEDHIRILLAAVLLSLAIVWIVMGRRKAKP